MALNLSCGETVYFQGPFTEKRYQVITLTNPNKDPVLFKIKTSDPATYSAVPSCGWVDPNENVSVKFIKLPTSNSNVSKDSREKFLVMSTTVTKKERRHSSMTTWKRYQDSDHLTFRKLSIVLSSGPNSKNHLVDVYPERIIEFTAQRKFRSPNLQTAEVTIYNKTDKPVAFKVKTKNQVDYGVRPNQGRIEPRQSYQIKIASAGLLTQQDPNKFLILAATIPPERNVLPYDPTSMDDIWTSSPNIARTKLDVLHQSVDVKEGKTIARAISKTKLKLKSKASSRHTSRAPSKASLKYPDDEASSGSGTLTFPSHCICMGDVPSSLLFSPYSLSGRCLCSY
ncbi:PapD-like protein [Pluteus cervinus]|uniref:PapD-like protein n=1 Tax=Pluteus cervinus TaxID=181527 RepID=A0ACD3A8W4_9AGAR|nr:PapD-like protein [Pluteus cervinus]